MKRNHTRIKKNVRDSIASCTNHDEKTIVLDDHNGAYSMDNFTQWGDKNIRLAIGLVAINLHNGHSLLRFRRLILLIVGAIIRGIAIAHKAVRDANNVKEPKQVERLQRRQQRRGDVLADPALVLLRLPVELKGPNGSKFGEEGDDDLDVDVVAQVDPDADKGEEVGRNQKVVEVVEHLGGGEEEVANVVRGVDGDANVGEVEAVAEPNEGEADHVVADELVAPWKR
ncbi:hypothetical protein NQ176_g8536 [Zarea fungicola]|uniref:Uncharacterized protein n=1 Tax=Zarea fungicola TaxID=93591 RepID=A0ACC1MSQ2_9HYPO|nr:hypothetical protein NQ176_g8536 [Lecanicillium fungicola]